MKLPCIVLILLAGIALANPLLLQPVESPPEEIGGLEFSIITQGTWTSGEDIILQLRVSNPGEEPILFETFDTFVPRLLNSDGERMSLSGGRRATTLTPTFLILPGTGYSYPLSATLRHPTEEKGITFEYRDGTGMFLSTPMEPGKYSISFSLENQNGGNSNEGAAPRWSAEGRTQAVEFEVVRAPEREREQ